MDTRSKAASRLTSRRAFLKTGLAAGAGVAGTALIGLPALADEAGSGITSGDAAILRFLAAIEIIETDLWQQYNELAGIQGDNVPGGSGSPAFTQAVSILDG